MRYTDHIVRVLHRLPLCTAAELAALCSLAPVTLREDLRRLIKAAWVERINLTDPDWERASGREQVYALSEAARRELLADLARAEADFGPLALWQLRPRSVPDAITAAPITRAAIHCLAQLAMTLARKRDGRLAWAAASPTPDAKQLLGDHDPLPWGHYEGHWLLDEEDHTRVARFAIHVDHFRVPPRQRGVRVRRWYRLGESIRSTMRSTMHFAPLLILCETEQDELLWDDACRRATGRGILGYPTIVTATIASATEPWGPDDEIWRRVGLSADSPRVPLSQLLRTSAVAIDGRPVDQGDEPLRQLESKARARMLPQRAAALSLRLTSYQHRVIELLARHRWLSARDLGRICDVTYEQADRECRTLPRDAVVAARAHDGERRYMLTKTSLQLTAARAGMGRNRAEYASANGVPWAQPDKPVPEPQAHRIGVNRVLGLLSQGAREAGMEVGEDLLTEHEWRMSEGDAPPIPDGGCTVWVSEDEDSWCEILFEYERPQRGATRLRTKFNDWEDRYRRRRGPAPLLLVVWDDAPAARTASTRLGSPPLAIQAIHSPDPGTPGIPVLGASASDLEHGAYSKACWLRPDGTRVSIKEALEALIAERSEMEDGES